MPVGIKTPANQIKFTNVSVVRLKKGMTNSDAFYWFVRLFFLQFLLCERC